MGEKDSTGTPPQREDANKIVVVPGRTTANISNTDLRKDGTSMQPDMDRVFLARLWATMAMVPITAAFVTVAAHLAFGGARPHAVSKSLRSRRQVTGRTK